MITELRLTLEPDAVALDSPFVWYERDGKWFGPEYIDIWDHSQPRPAWVWSPDVVDDEQFADACAEWLEPGERPCLLAFLAWRRRQLARAAEASVRISAAMSRRVRRQRMREHLDRPRRTAA